MGAEYFAAKRGDAILATDYTKKYCKDCEKSVKAERRGVNHVLHLILSICTGGLWLLVWIGISVKVGGWRCGDCYGKNLAGKAPRKLETMAVGDG